LYIHDHWTRQAERVPDPIIVATTATALRGAAASASLARAVGVVPPGRHRHHRHREDRYQAYLRFQQATFDVTAWILTTPAIAVTIPSIAAKFVHAPVLARAMTDSRAALAEFLAALAQVRLVGNPEPRAAAEETAALIGELAERLNMGGSRRERARQEERLGQVQRALGETHKKFILATRRDLGYARPLRTRWWQWRRPRSEEEWPGGWPGPAVQELLKGPQQQPQKPTRHRRAFRRLRG
jgi:hypothetical protein